MVNVASRESSGLDVFAMSTAMRWAAPVIAVTLAITMTYGFEIFSFHLTLDEELFGEASSTGYAQSWLSQGRWAMGVLTLMVPSPVVPVVSTLLGVVLTTVAVWLVCRNCMNMGQWPSALAASVACTLPTLPFMFSFSTIAYGIGIGNLLVVAYFAGITSSSWLQRTLGVLAFASAIGIYDSFLAAGAALAIAAICRRPTMISGAMVLLSVGLAALASRAIALLGQGLLRVEQDAYAAKFIDLSGLVADPIGRASRALSSVWDVAFLSEGRFGLHSPWLGVLLTAMVALAILAALRTTGLRTRLIHIAGVIALLAIPVAMELIAAWPVLSRSMVYLPIIIAVLSGWAFKGVATLPAKSAAITTGLLGAVAVLAVVGQATLANRLYAASEVTYAQDQNLAFLIGQEKERLVDADVGEHVAIYITGTHQWAPSALLPARENLGVSFFAGQAGPDAIQYRTAAFLRSQGVAVRMPDAEEIARSEAKSFSLPSYPETGWISYDEGVLLINFGQGEP
jgi:hypothetical protein